ncbi:MAG: cysteine hydrolase [Anaerolineae bacterium]|nr:cysteine hydrolase [Anaerolineae bacterium]MBT7071722.1 cysteine hydrolase [Anaerolineae bacterium]MBT7325248.1 cysteine hydrolase [Anaerolineae bacterium]
MKTALLVVDAQANMFDEEFCVYNADEIAKNIRYLIETARKAKVPIVFVRNNGGANDPDQPNTPGWKIHAPFAPLAGEKIVDKTGADAFNGTDLQAFLSAQEIEYLIVAGMQSEVCITSSGERAVALGYQVTLVEDAHTTFDFDGARHRCYSGSE